MSALNRRLQRIRSISYVAYKLVTRRALGLAKQLIGWEPSIHRTALNQEWQHFAPAALSTLASQVENINEPVGEDFFRSLQDDSVICCHGSSLGSLTNEESDGAHTLVTFGSDEPFDDKKKIALQGKFTQVFSINTTAIASWITCLPIGLESRRRCPFDKFSTLRDCRALHQPPSKLLYGNFSLWTNRSKRFQCLSAFERKDYFTSRVATALPPAHALTANEYRSFCLEVLDLVFVACPEGNGIDTHRMWETLCLGRIPVVLHNPVTDAFPALPVLRLKRWKDFEPCCIEFLRTLPQKSFSLDALSPSYWRAKIVTPQKRNSIG